ncbi:N-6 DNA methylase [Lancefieldella parvula DSM 20469]|uniref:site-specific DNA-methyltransferase (adenine-specific) n=1 Tax=Lancefieldella parvula (strain ATCC 33793 / DSM 20469 / CCUG 32760 / JCM 10300 / KCTC 3663 / VPI 0546 / 1246) TaxID=521095 RepID=C8W944_LANP1|nr:class I SAM-dependent DNA methyltransferase [Lancefieldella parvula]ACV50632.1 N-6 DNA methylase [Lancefieldella parvula DSM 20469]
MITGATKSKVDDVWQRMWEGGITNPQEVITQLTYLMFIRSLDDKELESERMEELGIPQEYLFPQTSEGQEMRWCSIKNMAPEKMLEAIRDKVFPFIKTLHDDTPFARSMRDATFGINNPRTLQKAVSGIDSLMNDFENDMDDLGDLYEYMLSKLSTAGTNGQFRTPKHIRDMMVAMVDPRPGERICDPAMGTAGFLISAADHLRNDSAMKDDDWTVFAGEAAEKDADGNVVAEGRHQFSGGETDQTMFRISAMNLMLHGISQPDIKLVDSVSKQNTTSDKYDLVLANPPFTGSVDTEDIAPSLKAICNSKQTELLFVALFLRMLKVGGRCACIVPNGVLFRTNSKAYRQLRQELVDNQQLRAIIYMPSGVFKPYSGVSTAVLVFTKTNAGGTDKVWLYNMEGDGYTLDDKRDIDDAHNDVPDILERWAHLESEEKRDRKQKSFLVSKQDIIDNDYDFSFNKYVETEYERIEYPPTEQIVAELDELNKEMATGLAELKKVLGGGLDD